MTAMNIAGSPFSLAHSWTLHWERLPSNLKRMEYFSANSNKEKRAVDAISKVGVIGGQQLHQPVQHRQKTSKADDCRSKNCASRNATCGKDYSYLHVRNKRGGNDEYARILPA
ncbi:hypothetical protein ACA29_02960 [Lederbergia galactosidilytica]|uniref:Uncharacterized protein n=1 Tax=Lederbergia galactosidilytica TaxID=217031 RepID=A0A0Q9YJD9_9BACI|nr:hypothetical protein ACA29_02960 [Lederbergia galactosidilytica]